MQSEEWDRSGREDEIGVRELADFVADEGKRLLAAACLAMLLAGGGAWLLGGYKASSLIINSGPQARGNDAFDFVKWKYFQTGLPDLAAELLQKGRVAADDEAQFRRMARAEWWNKSVTPVFALSKNDSKLLGSISKELQDFSGTLIQYLAVEDSGRTVEAAERSVATSVVFIRSGAAYLALRRLLFDLDAATATADASLRKQIVAAELEMEFFQQKARNLEQLARRFPGKGSGAGALGQVLDPKDAAAKYLPLETQLIALQSDIYNLEESLTRLRNQQVEQAVVRGYLDAALPALAEITDGQALGDELLRLVDTRRQEVKAADLVRQGALTGLESSVRSVVTAFGKGLQTSHAPQATRNGKIGLIAALGFVGGGLAMLVYALIRRSLARERATRPERLRAASAAA